MPSLKLRTLFRHSSDSPSLRERAAATASRVEAFKAAPPDPVPAQPSDLAQACDQAIVDWNAISPRSQAEDWGDEQLDEALDAYGAVFRRAIVEPSREVDELRAKARLLLHDIEEHDPTGRDEAALTDDKRLTRVVLREVAGLSSSTALTPVDPTDWHAPPSGFMAHPAIDPQGFVIVREGLRLELERLHRIALAEYARKVGPEASDADRARVRRELRLDVLEQAACDPVTLQAHRTPDALSAEILALWPAWAAHTGDDGTDEQTAAYDVMQERRFSLLHAADSLPATPDNIQPKALALAWLHYVNEWRRGQKRSEYCIDERLAIDIHMAALAQGEPGKDTARTFEPSIVGMLDLASASLEDLQALHDIADLVGSVAYASCWQSRSHARGWREQFPPGDQYNVAGKLMQWLGDALSEVEAAANDEARRRSPTTSADRETRLEILALPVIQNGDPDENGAFARDLLAHVEAEREGR